MIAKIFDLEESKLYDSLSDEYLEQCLTYPQKIELSNDPKIVAFHLNKKAYNRT